MTRRTARGTHGGTTLSTAAAAAIARHQQPHARAGSGSASSSSTALGSVVASRPRRRPSTISSAARSRVSMMLCPAVGSSHQHRVRDQRGDPVAPPRAAWSGRGRRRSPRSARRSAASRRPGRRVRLRNPTSGRICWPSRASPRPGRAAGRRVRRRSSARGSRSGRPGPARCGTALCARSACRVPVRCAATASRAAAQQQVELTVQHSGAAEAVRCPRPAGRPPGSARRRRRAGAPWAPVGGLRRRRRPSSTRRIGVAHRVDVVGRQQRRIEDHRVHPVGVPHADARRRGRCRRTCRR